MNFLVEIINDSISGGLHDSYIVGSYGNLPLSNGTPVDSIWWRLKDNTASALSSDALPTVTPILGQWQGNVLGFGADRLYGISAHVTNAIPEPGTIILVGVGAVVLRKRR